MANQNLKQYSRSNLQANCPACLSPKSKFDPKSVVLDTFFPLCFSISTSTVYSTLLGRAWWSQVKESGIGLEKGDSQPPYLGDWDALP